MKLYYINFFFKKNENYQKFKSWIINCYLLLVFFCLYLKLEIIIIVSLSFCLYLKKHKSILKSLNFINKKSTHKALI